MNLRQSPHANGPACKLSFAVAVIFTFCNPAVADQPALTQPRPHCDVAGAYKAAAENADKFIKLSSCTVVLDEIELAMASAPGISVVIEDSTIEPDVHGTHNIRPGLQNCPQPVVRNQNHPPQELQEESLRVQREAVAQRVGCIVDAIVSRIDVGDARHDKTGEIVRQWVQNQNRIAPHLGRGALADISTTISAPLAFVRCTFAQSEHGEYVSPDVGLNIGGVLFLEPVTVADSVVQGSVRIQQTVFAASFDMKSTKVNGDVFLTEILAPPGRSSAGVALHKVELSGNLYVNQSYIELLGASGLVSNSVTLHQLTVGNAASFGNATIAGKLWVLHSTLPMLGLGGTQYFVIDTPPTLLKGGLAIEFSTVGSLSTSRVEVDGPVQIVDSSIGNAVDYNSGLSLSETTVKGDLSIVRGSLDGLFELDGIDIRDRLLLTGVQFGGHLRPVVSRASVRDFEVPWQDMPNLSKWNEIPILRQIVTEQVAPERASESLGHIASQLRKSSQLAERNVISYWAQWHEYKEQVASEAFFGRFGTRVVWGVKCVPSRCGTDLRLIVIVLLIEIAAFASLYFALCSLHRSSDAHPSGSVRMHLLYVPAGVLAFPPDSADLKRTVYDDLSKAATLSVLQSLRMGPKHIAVMGNRAHRGTRWLIRLHWIVGAWLLIQLVVTLGNTQPLLNSLIRGLL